MTIKIAKKQCDSRNKNLFTILFKIFVRLTSTIEWSGFSVSKYPWLLFKWKYCPTKGKTGLFWLFPPQRTICSTKMNNNNQHHQYIMVVRIFFCSAVCEMQFKRKHISHLASNLMKQTHLTSIFMSHFEVRNYYAFQAHVEYVISMQFETTTRNLFIMFVLWFKLKWNQITLQDHFYCVHSFHWNLKPDPTIISNSQQIHRLTFIWLQFVYAIWINSSPCVQQTHYKTIPIERELRIIFSVFYENYEVFAKYYWDLKPRGISIIQHQKNTLTNTRLSIWLSGLIIADKKREKTVRLNKINMIFNE